MNSRLRFSIRLKRGYLITSVRLKDRTVFVLTKEGLALDEMERSHGETSMTVVLWDRKNKCA